MESADEACVCAELAERGIKFERQRALPMMYEGVRLDCGYRLDLVVRGSILLELSKWSEEAHA
jgi:GxxExxY protein